MLEEEQWRVRAKARTTGCQHRGVGSLRNQLCQYTGNVIRSIQVCKMGETLIRDTQCGKGCGNHQRPSRQYDGQATEPNGIVEPIGQVHQIPWKDQTVYAMPIQVQQATISKLIQCLPKIG